MRFAYTEEQIELRDAVRGYLRANVDSAELRRAVEPGAEHSSKLWKAIAEQLGLTGLAVNEEHGGSGAGFVELSVVLEETGAVLLPLPFFASAVLAVTALQQSGDDEAQERWLPALAAGELIGTFAHHGSFDDVTARRTKDGWELTGEKRYVIEAEAAGLLLVPARTDSGVSLFAVDAATSGLTRAGLETMDPTRRLADVRFDSVSAHLVGAEGAAQDGLARTLDIAAVALSAEMVGVAQRALDIAVEYAGTRMQFDRPIGSFQAVKHKAADMFVALETARALVMRASWAVASDADDVPELASLTLAHVSDACFSAVAQLLQILGGIGYTWEHDAHFYFKRGKASGLLLGSADLHREVVAEAIGL